MYKSKYEKNLSTLCKTYKWALYTSIDKIETAIARCIDSPIIAIGSGGSLTVANMLALLHSKFTSESSCFMTPLDFLTSYDDVDPNVGFILITAGGRNYDILSILKEVIYKEPHHVIVICGTRDTPVSNYAKKYKFVHIIELDPPFQRDGYLATNSLLAFSLLLIRSYYSTFSEDCALPTTLERLLCEDENLEMYLASLTRNLEPLLSRNTIIALYGGWSRPAAYDLESKFTEAALGNISIADYRNFGHGRHFWLVQHGNSSGVIAFIEPNSKRLAKKTLDLIPANIPILKLSTRYEGAAGALAQICNVLYMVKIAGDYKGIDPGKPGVPKFGRLLYNLRITVNELPSYNLLSKARNRHLVAILRKTPEAAKSNRLLDLWTKAYYDFVYNLKQTAFKSIVLDYDGTLCDPEERFQGISPELADKLVRLLEEGIVVGIATGRGKSVRQDLHRKIPKDLREQVWIGYYNGGDIATLNDKIRPIKSKDLHPALQSVNELLEDSWLREICTWEVRPYQISITEIEKPFTVKKVRTALIDILKNKKVKVLESLHSVDILAPGISKRLLVDIVRKTSGGEVLCIGDKGKYPGNDYELLTEPYSLSVYEVSQDPKTCWNIASLGYRFTQATLEYLSSIVPDSGKFHFKIRGVKNERHTS